MKTWFRTLGGIFFWLILVMAYIINTIFVIPSLDEPHDFGSFFAAGQFAVQGKNPYSTDSELIYGVTFPIIGHSGLAPNLNPPILVLLFKGLAHFQMAQVLAVWRIVSVRVFLIAVFFLFQKTPNPRSPDFVRRTLLTFAQAGFWHAIQLGQVYTIMLLIAAAAWVWLKQGRSANGGIALGILIAIKPNFVFWGLALAAAKNWKAFLMATSTAISLSILPVFFYGPQVYAAWLEASATFTPNLLIFPANNSLQGLTARFGSPQLGIMLSIILAGLTLVLIHKKKYSHEKTNTLGILVSLLISPLAWTGYTLIALPILLENPAWNWRYWLAALIFVVPFFVPLALFQASFFNFVFFGWFYGWGLLILLGDAVFDRAETADL
jgi:hypothetical protein